MKSQVRRPFTALSADGVRILTGVGHARGEPIGEREVEAGIQQRAAFGDQDVGSKPITVVAKASDAPESRRAARTSASMYGCLDRDITGLTTRKRVLVVEPTSWRCGRAASCWAC